MKAKWMMKIVLGAIVFGALAGWLVMSLWNWLVPALFAGPVIGFWQALGLLLLSRILLGSPKSWGGGRRCRDAGWKERWDGMSPEERERVRSLWKQRCRRSVPTPPPAGETES
jgi:hypothetical protein